MSKRKDIENPVVEHPDAKRIRNLSPLRDSPILNSGARDISLSKGTHSEESSEEITLLPCPIGDCPDEVLERIFTHHDLLFSYGGIDLSKTSPLSGGVASSPIPWVSKRWRGITMRNRALFRVVTTYQKWNSDGPEEVQQRLLEYMERDEGEFKTSTLQLGPMDIHLDEEPVTLPPSFIASCVPANNIQSLIITSVSCKDLASIKPAKLFPQLARLILKPHEDDVALFTGTVTMFEDCTNLTHVTLIHGTLSVPGDGEPKGKLRNLVKLPLTQVTHYMENRRNWNSHDLPTIFYAPRFKNLKSLVLRMPYSVDIRSLERLRSMEFPRLESLVIVATPLYPEGGVPGLELLNYMRMTNLKHLGLVGHSLDFDDEHWEETDSQGTLFLTALRALEALTSISLSFPKIRRLPLRRVLRAVKQVKSLDIHVTNCKPALTRILNELEIKEGDPNPHLPKLEEFTFDVTNEGHPWRSEFCVRNTQDSLFDSNAIQAFIKSRRGPGLPLGVSQLHTVIMFTDWNVDKQERMKSEVGAQHAFFYVRHLSASNYWHLRKGWQQDRWLERTKALDEEYEAKQLFPSANL
ncbi:hypothetical protein NMY22_g3135 [Coprinellus aureogranulatus]|nr:hypothetical protein NMY22_g3135 [Coprinellus aureogranulatus]